MQFPEDLLGIIATYGTLDIAVEVLTLCVKRNPRSKASSFRLIGSPYHQIIRIRHHGRLVRSRMPAPMGIYIGVPSLGNRDIPNYPVR